MLANWTQHAFSTLQSAFIWAINLFVTWTKFIQIPNAVQPKPMKMERIVGSVSREFFWSVEIEQPLLVAKLTRAEINGLAACRCVRRPPSLNEILFILIWCPFPLPACSSQVLFERSSHAWTKSELICKQANEVRAMWDAQHKTVLWKQVWVLECVLREIIGFVLDNYAYLRLGSFESGCMHNLLKSIPAPRCLKSWTC